MDVVTRQEVEAYLEQFDELPPKGVNTDIIKDVSARMAEFTGRKDWGEQEARTEYYDGGTQYLLVDFWPVTSVASVYDDTDHQWGSSSLIESDDYHISSKDDGIIFFEYYAPQCGYQNLKVTYTGGYNGTADVPAQVKRAALLQIRYEEQRNQPGRFTNVPGRYDGAEFDEFTGMGLLGEVRVLLQAYKRRRYFA